jgi:hypothetical protein
MSFRVLVCCDGTPEERPTMALETCRAFLSLAPAPEPDLALAINSAGWKVRERDGAHLCPTCTRSVGYRP